MILRNLYPPILYRLNTPSVLKRNRTRCLSFFLIGRLAHIYRTQRPPCYFLNAARLISTARSDKSLVLPRSCPGCGAFAQCTSPNQAGFYDFARKAVQAFVVWTKNIQTRLQEPRSSDPSFDLTQQFNPGELNGDQGMDIFTGVS